MFHTGLNAMRAGAVPLGSIDCSVVTGVPQAVTALAAEGPQSHSFLREAWVGCGKSAALSTLVAQRHDGSPVLALPMRQIGPPGMRCRAIAGSYWPFRSAAVSSTATVEDMVAVFENPVAQSVIGPLLRLGPIYETDRLAVLMAKAARQSGWHVLTRQMGQTFVQDIAGPDDAVPWPSASRRRKVRRLTGQLQKQGQVTMRIVRGAAWSRQAFADLASIEANSWVGKRTDRSGAKFLNPDMIAHWQRAVVDPVIAQMLAAAILYVGDRPIAFSLDLTAGALQYGIASSYDEAFASYSPGQIITVHAIDDSIARGVRQIDWGAGDSGYKQALGAKPGALIHDLLIVRHASLAAALRPRWEESIESGTLALAAGLADAMKTTLLPGGLTLKHLLLSGLALSAAASAFTE